MSDPLIQLGVYEHFTGNRYRVTGFGHHVTGANSDERVGDEVVVYHALFRSPKYGERHTWVRPVANFVEEVEIDGRRVPRFRYVAESSAT
ncbi:hypothetical protein GCM10017673_14230 [Streptosporangium violaceochromogenes]|nr:hypothetical protein GCM10017673_14230 [Streptosporangium violaceochromogenes]